MSLIKPVPLAFMTWKKTGGGDGCGVEACRGHTAIREKKKRRRGRPGGAKLKAGIVICVPVTAGRNDVKAVSRVVGCAAEAPGVHTATGGNSNAGEADGEAGKSKGGFSRSYSPLPLAMTRW